MIGVLELFVVLIIVFIIFSAVFSGSETALTAANRSKIHGLEMAGNKRALKVTELMVGSESTIICMAPRALSEKLTLLIIGSAEVIWIPAVAEKFTEPLL